MDYIGIPSVLKKMNRLFEESGFKAYLVGGAVRDCLMKKIPSDWDVTTDATPQQVMSIFHKVIPTGIAHGTVTVHFMGQEIEVTTFRTEEGYSDGRHPDKVFYTWDLYEDLSRRDFTMNAIAASLKDGKIEDPFDGRADIKNGIIRTVGTPGERFFEDGLRPIRAIRFCAKLGFSIELETLNAIKDPRILEVTKGISIERFRDEFLKILASDKPSIAIKLMEDTGLLNIFLPEVAACRNCIQNDFRGYHIFDVFDHNMYACDGAPKDKMNVRLAALFHDVGKPQAKRTNKTKEGEIFNFFNHEKYSASISKQVLFRLKLPNAVIDNVCHLIENHMFHYESKWSDAAVRRFLVRVGIENVEDLFDLRFADMYGKYNEDIRIHDSPAIALLLEFKDRIKEIYDQEGEVSLKSLAVNGRDLMAEGIPGGKHLGFILNELLETVLDDPSMNQREELLKIARNIYAVKFKN